MDDVLRNRRDNVGDVGRLGNHVRREVFAFAFKWPLQEMDSSEREWSTISGSSKQSVLETRTLLGRGR